MNASSVCWASGWRESQQGSCGLHPLSRYSLSRGHIPTEACGYAGGTMRTGREASVRLLARTPLHLLLGNSVLLMQIWRSLQVRGGDPSQGLTCQFGRERVSWGES